MARSVTSTTVTTPGCPFKTKGLGTGKVPPGNALGGKRASSPRNGDKSGTKKNNSKGSEHVKRGGELCGREKRSRKRGESMPICSVKTPARGIWERNIRSRRKKNRKMIAAGVVIKDRPMEVEEKRRGAESEVQTRKGLGAEIEMSRRTSIEKGKVKSLKKTLKGPSTGSNDGVPPKRMATIKVANNKEWGREARK